MTDTQEGEAVGTMDCPLCTSIEQCLCVDRGRWGTKAADRIATLTRQLAEARAENIEARRELEEWKQGNRAHIAAENVANSRRKEAECQLAEARAEIERLKK